MKKVVRSLSLVALIGLFSARSFAASPDASMQFTVMAALNATNIYAATMETVSGQDQDVIDYAQRELLRYTQLSTRLVSYAAEKNIEIISLQQALNDLTLLQTAQVIYGARSLANLSGADLDKAFLAQMVKLNAYAISTLNVGVSRMGQTEEAKFLSNLLPQLQESLATAQRLSKKFATADVE